ncbi:MAG: NADH dehydrogenase subunit F [Anaerolineaceae bacterium]|nr:NADH-quinone oxidoreductase subunit E [Anaerolineae bacterium]MDL1925721.1 NADH-quinone oxidoreductase subunit E [Anaerolineae bacterium AMX1]WKZ55690.1 MAG: NAD(P)H-dependent oxidoreductase subunit E [Anaerolineales bacterium]GJQ38641.1 MAG: NADH dehydrogenase subunit F [Anaerolineaceae bacterium]HMM97588.1 NAD(P)H-dependent oxidoreductase subunit E [Anaerolineales bacterium]
MTEIDLTPLQPALEKFIPLRRSGLLPALHAAQEIYGWLPREVAAEVAKTLHVPLADVHGVIEFYSLFYNEPVGRKIIRVCTDPACALKDADGLLARLRSQHGIEDGQTTPDGTLTIERSPCLGLCEHAPATWTVDGGISTVGDGTAERDRPQSVIYGSLRMLTVNCGNGTTSLAKYGEYAALKKARAMKPEEVVNEIKSSGLVGRGGAGFNTALKWEGAAKADGSPKYVICNADESEPGTFKDRVLLLDDPHRAIEGMCIAAHAVGASKGYVYLRGEYPYILPPLENALNEARAAGYLNEDFDIEIRVGAGAYICGEETALFESIEGKRGFPRVKPPFPTTNGLFDKPTVINNVETLFNVPLIIEKGAAEYRKIGTEKSSGPKLFCLSGDVARPGVYEVPFGITLRELLEMAGGVTGGLQSILFGGAAGAFATSAQLDVKLTFEDLRAAGLPLGSGVVMVFNETRDMRDVLKRLGRFFAHESCGKCYPCQMGTQRQMEILERVASKKILPEDALRLQDVGWTMTDASLCGLGQTAASAVLSAMKLWPEIFKDEDGNAYKVTL